MADYKDLVAADLRLSILLILAEMPGYDSNLFVLRRALEAYGHRVSADALAAQCAKLADMALLEMQAPAGVPLVTLTARGLDVSQGRTEVPGVTKPAPRA